MVTLQERVTMRSSLPRNVRPPAYVEDSGSYWGTDYVVLPIAPEEAVV
jgi:hypothetical protein